jgi:hypothetical protein
MPPFAITTVEFGCAALPVQSITVMCVRASDEFFARIPEARSKEGKWRDTCAWPELESYGQILAGTDSPAASKQTGEGNFTAVNGQDEYYYAYCFRQRDRALIVARAPVSNPYPGNWMKFFKGKWDQPGLGGDATALTGGSGISVARVRTSACALQACQSQTASGRRLPFFVSRRCFYRPRCLSKNWTVTS